MYYCITCLIQQDRRCPIQVDWQIRDDAPIYSQLVAQIKLGIAAGALSPGERLPSVRDLATEAGVNPNTMQRALQELERQGLVYSQRTSGRFVTEDREMIEAAKSALAAEQVRSFLDAMARLGYMRDDILRLIEARIKEENGNGEL